MQGTPDRIEHGGVDASSHPPNRLTGFLFLLFLVTVGVNWFHDPLFWPLTLLTTSLHETWSLLLGIGVALCVTTFFCQVLVFLVGSFVLWIVTNLWMILTFQIIEFVDHAQWLPHYLLGVTHRPLAVACALGIMRYIDGRRLCLTNELDQSDKRHQYSLRQLLLAMLVTAIVLLVAKAIRAALDAALDNVTLATSLVVLINVSRMAIIAVVLVRVMFAKRLGWLGIAKVLAVYVLSFAFVVYSYGDGTIPPHWFLVAAVRATLPIAVIWWIRSCGYRLQRPLSDIGAKSEVAVT